MTHRRAAPFGIRPLASICALGTLATAILGTVSLAGRAHCERAFDVRATGQPAPQCVGGRDVLSQATGV